MIFPIAFVSLFRTKRANANYQLSGGRKFWSTIELLEKIEILVKNRNSSLRSKFCSKPKFWSKIQFSVKNANFDKQIGLLVNNQNSGRNCRPEISARFGYAFQFFVNRPPGSTELIID